MTIDVTNLKTEINKFNKILEDYENIYLNMYNEFSASSFFWYDENAKRFFSDLNKQKMSMNTTFNELSELKKVYSYIIISYEKIGKKIYYETRNKNEIITNIKDYINNLKSIIKIYNNLDLQYCNEVSNKIMNEKTKLNDTLKNVIELYNKVNKFYRQVEEIEKEVNLRILRINIEIVKENLVNDYV